MLVVEDIVDTGMTLQHLVKQLEAREPASLRVCALLDKRARRLVDTPIDYVGFEIPDEFVVGYGLDYRQRFRNLPFVATLRSEALVGRSRERSRGGVRRMPEARERPSSRQSARPRLPRFSDLFDISEEMITFAEKYQKVWESESKAMLALGEFLGGRAESMRYQVELMRMGSDSFRRYSQWSEALLSLRPDTLIQSFMRPPERPDAETAGDEAST